MSYWIERCKKCGKWKVVLPPPDINKQMMETTSGSDSYTCICEFDDSR